MPRPTNATKPIADKTAIIANTRRSMAAILLKHELCPHCAGLAIFFSVPSVPPWLHRSDPRKSFPSASSPATPLFFLNSVFCLVPSALLLAIGHWSLVILWSLIIGHWSFSSDLRKSLQSASSAATPLFLLNSVFCLPPSAFCLLPSVFCLLSTGH